MALADKAHLVNASMQGSVKNAKIHHIQKSVKSMKQLEVLKKRQEIKKS